MEKFTKDILDIAAKELDCISEKVKGLNFLEILKINLIEKLLPLINKHKLSKNHTINFEKEVEQKFRKIKILLNYYVNPLSITKKTVENDSLIISFNESSNFDVYSDKKSLTSILLYKNTGISLPKDTVINLKINKNVLFLEIKNIDIEPILAE